MLISSVLKRRSYRFKSNRYICEPLFHRWVLTIPITHIKVKRGRADRIRSLSARAVVYIHFPLCYTSAACAVGDPASSFSCCVSKTFRVREGNASCPLSGPCKNGKKVQSGSQLLNHLLNTRFCVSLSV
jgi:hypothetical protein